MNRSRHGTKIASYDAKARLKFVDSPEFHQPGAESLIIVPLPQLKYQNRAKAGDWYSQMMAVEPLPRDQQRDCFRMMNYLKFRASVAEDSDARRQLIDRALQVREVLALSNRRLISLAIGRVLDRLRRANRDEFGDAVSEACKSLLTAVDKFDYALGFSFSTFACRSIMFGRRNHWRRQSRTEVRTTQFAEFEDGGSVIDYVESKEAAPNVEAARREVAQKVRRLFRTLTERQREIVESCFGFNGPPETLEAIGERLGVCGSRIGQIRDAAIEKLYAVITGAA